MRPTRAMHAGKIGSAPPAGRKGRQPSIELFEYADQVTLSKTLEGRRGIGCALVRQCRAGRSARSAVEWPESHPSRQLRIVNAVGERLASDGNERVAAFNKAEIMKSAKIVKAVDVPSE